MDTNGDGRIDQYGVSITPGWWAADIAWIWANGGQVFSSDLSKCMVDNAKAREAIQFMVDLTNKYKVTPKGIIGSEVSSVAELFMTSKLGMYLGLPYQALSDFSTCEAQLGYSPDALIQQRAESGPVYRRVLVGILRQQTSPGSLGAGQAPQLSRTAQAWRN
ncbi:MAG: hypothetical protein ACOX1G_01305 [bacterium]